MCMRSDRSQPQHCRLQLLQRLRLPLLGAGKQPSQQALCLPYAVLWLSSRQHNQAWTSLQPCRASLWLTPQVIVLFDTASQLHCSA